MIGSSDWHSIAQVFIKGLAAEFLKVFDVLAAWCGTPRLRSWPGGRLMITIDDCLLGWGGRASVPAVTH